MLEPVMSSFTIEDDVLKDFIKILVLIGKTNIRISSDFLQKSLSNFMDDKNKALLSGGMVLDNDFLLLYKYLNVFIDENDKLHSEIGNHIEFKYSKKVVWGFLGFLLTLDNNFQIKKTIIVNHLKNDSLYFDSAKFNQLVTNILSNIESNEHSLTFSSVENVLFILSKIISVYNYVKINNTVVKSLGKVVSGNSIDLDSQSLGEIQSVVEEMTTTSVSGAVDELIIDDENFNVEAENLNYPIVPVKVFKNLKLFQEKRVFLFVGASGVGKSMILCHITAEMWLNTVYKKAPNEAVFYFTMENLKEEVAARTLANSFYSQCGINKTIDDVIAGKMSSTEKNELRQKIKNVSRKLIIEYLPPKIYGAYMLRSLIKKHKVERGVEPYAIIVDYLDLLRTENKDVKDEHQALGEVVNELKALAGEFSVPVISVSHLNAEGCKMVKEDMASLGGRQMGKSLRKYENSDVIIFVDEYMKTGLAYAIMNAFVAKHRYVRKQDNKIYDMKYLPEYSYLGNVNEKMVFEKTDSNDEEMTIESIFSTTDLGL
jgi:hypothetical protein